MEVLRWSGRVRNMHIDACCFLAIVVFNRIVRELQAIQFRSVPLTSHHTNLLEACVRSALKNAPGQHHRVHAGAVQQDHFASPTWLRGIKYINAQGRQSNRLLTLSGRYVGIKYDLGTVEEVAELARH